MRTKKKTYADRAKSIMKKYEPRLGEKFDKGDILSLEAMNQELRGLQNEQEKARVMESVKNANTEQISQLSQAFQQQSQGGEQPQTTDQYSLGGKIDVDAFTYAEGGRLPQYEGGGFTPSYATTPTLNTPELSTNFASQGINFGSSPETMANTFAPSQVNQANLLDWTPDTQSKVGGDPFQERVPWLGSALNAASSLIGSKIDPEVGKIKPRSLTPETVSYEPERQALRRDYTSAVNVLGRQGASTGSRAAMMENRIAGITGAQKNLGRGLSSSYQNEGNINAQLGQQAGLAEFRANTQADIYNSRIEQQAGIYNTRLQDQKFQGLLGAGTQYMQDRLGAGQRNAMYQMMTPRNQRLNQINDTPFKRAMGFSADPEMQFFDTNDQAPMLSFQNMFSGTQNPTAYQQYMQMMGGN